MTPIDFLLSTDWTPLVAAVLLVVSVVATAFGVRNYHRPPVTRSRAPRTARRVPADERDLFGDDWRDCVVGYFADWGPTRQHINLIRHNQKDGAEAHTRPAPQPMEVRSNGSTR